MLQWFNMWSRQVYADYNLHNTLLSSLHTGDGIWGHGHQSERKWEHLALTMHLHLLFQALDFQFQINITILILIITTVDVSYRWDTIQFSRCNNNFKIWHYPLMNKYFNKQFILHCRLYLLMFLYLFNFLIHSLSLSPSLSIIWYETLTFLSLTLLFYVIQILFQHYICHLRLREIL